MLFSQATILRLQIYSTHLELALQYPPLQVKNISNLVRELVGAADRINVTGDVKLLLDVLVRLTKYLEDTDLKQHSLDIENGLSALFQYLNGLIQSNRYS